MRVQRVQLLSAILLAVAIIETSTTEQTNEILNDEVDGDASREFIFDKDFDKYLQAEDNTATITDDSTTAKATAPSTNDTNTATDDSTTTKATAPSTNDTNTATDDSTTTKATAPSTNDTNTATDDSTTTEATAPSTNDTNTATDDSTTTEATAPSTNDTNTATDDSTTTEATAPSTNDTNTATDDPTTTEATAPPTNDTTAATDPSTPTEVTDPTDDKTTATDDSIPTEVTDPTDDKTNSTDDSTPTKVTDPTEPPPTGSEEYPIKVSTCIFANMTITLEVTYEMKNDTTATGTLSVPPSPEVDGACNGNEAVMILTWKPTVSGRNVRDLDDVYAPDPEKNKLTLHFKRSDTEFWLDKMDIDIILDEENFPNAKNSTLSTTTDANLNLFSAPVSNSKSVCNAEISVNTKDENVKMQIKDVDLIAFNEESDITSKSESNCVKEEDVVVETSDVGAIVGGIIGALAIVGIIGFIIWRRRRNSYARSEVA